MIFYGCGFADLFRGASLGYFFGLGFEVDVKQYQYPTAQQRSRTPTSYFCTRTIDQSKLCLNLQWLINKRKRVNVVRVRVCCMNEKQTLLNPILLLQSFNEHLLE